MPSKLQLPSVGTVAYNKSTQNLLKEVESLKQEIKQLKSRKKYGLVWDSEKEPEKVVGWCKEKLPVLAEDREREVKTGDRKPVNVLIQGDNYHALSVLNYTHKEKIDLIYIDPPYNTGSEGFMYNDKIVNREDSYRHSKWINFMDKRLRLAKNLLKKDGIILINIDDNEIAQLKLLCDEIFGEDYFRNAIAWAYRTGGAPHKNDAFSRKHDYILMYSRSKDYFFNRFKEKIPYEKDFFGAKKDEKGKFYADVNLRDVIEGDITLFKDGEEYKKISVKPVLNLSSERVEDFPTQKPIGLLKYFLEILSRPNSIILDFFAGSGSTGHAVLDLNRENNDRRKFILCTDNENSICTKICYPRLKRQINGFKKSNGKKVAGLGGNLKYFKTDFVEGELTDKNKKNLVDKSTEMLCLKEDCFEEVKQGKSFKMFKSDKEKYLGIIYEDDGIENFKKEVKKLNKNFVVYIFSLDESAREEEFEDIKDLVELKPIPAVILNVYKRIFKL
ncbi:MAG: DNA methyltransferase [Patescibacteria group bacterium]